MRYSSLRYFCKEHGYLGISNNLESMNERMWELHALLKWYAKLDVPDIMEEGRLVQNDDALENHPVMVLIGKIVDQYRDTEEAVTECLLELINKIPEEALREPEIPEMKPMEFDAT